MLRIKRFRHCLVMLAAIQPMAAVHADQRRDQLEEVIVTAQKREQSLQEAPLAVSVLDAEQLNTQRIYGLEGLSGGAIPSLRIQPYTDAPSTLIVAIRGNGPTDAGPIIREGTVGIYLDGIYLDRPQALAMDVSDLERIEVLRGPQGTLFGRNTIGGAVSMISKKPTGTFGFEQTLSRGNYDAWRSETHINLPEVAGFSLKLDYIHSERDGWVKNSAPGEWDYNAYQKDGGRISLSYRPSDEFTADAFAYQAEMKASQNYFQIYSGAPAPFGNERDRESHTRMPVSPLDPTHSSPQGYGLTLNWNPNAALTLKSISGFVGADEKTRNNYNVALFGMILADDLRQRQFSQEFQALYKEGQFDSVGGIYYFRGWARESKLNYYSLDLGGSWAPMTPTTFGAPATDTRAESETYAAYGQTTWTPAFDERLHLTAGLRWTHDNKAGVREVPGVRQDFDFNNSHLDGSVTVSYDWLDNLSTYAKWGTGYQAGGANPRSATFRAYDEETVRAWEFGLKSEFLNRRLRINADVFRTDISNLPSDVEDKFDVSITDTLSNPKTARIQGFEADITAAPLEGLLLGLSYTYLDTHMPPLANPLSGGELEQFLITQAPRHAGAASIDYTLPRLGIGELRLHLDATSTSEYAYVAIGKDRQDAYTLINGSITLADIRMANLKGAFQTSVWGKNLANEEYVVAGFPIGASIIQAFGEPRTFGIDVTYKY